MGTINNNGSAMCGGGVISRSKFESNPWAYMMSYYMEDDKFAQYVAEKNKKKQKELFNKYAQSAIG